MTMLILVVMAATEMMVLLQLFGDNDYEDNDETDVDGVGGITAMHFLLCNIFQSTFGLK